MLPMDSPASLADLSMHNEEGNDLTDFEHLEKKLSNQRYGAEIPNKPSREYGDKQLIKMTSEAT